MKKLLLLVLGILSFLNLNAQSTQSLRITHGPWLQNFTQEGVTICFTTNLPVVPGILLTTTAGKPDSLIRNSTDGMVNAGGTLHKVRISGLTPGTTYRYKVNPVEILKFKPYQVYYGDTVRSKEYTFTTQNPGKKTTRFMVVNDIHTNGGKLANLLRAGEASGSDLVFFNGDMLDYVEGEEQLLGPIIDTSVRYFASGAPFVMVRGNHETRGILARRMKDFLEYPENRFYYAFDDGPVHFIVLDCGEDKTDDNRYYYGLADYDRYRTEQLEWLKKEVASEAFRKAAYRIYIIHMPIRQGSDAHGMLFLADNFGPVIKEAGGDLLIAGHLHQHFWLDTQLSGLGFPMLINSNTNCITAEATAEGLKVRVVTEKNETILEKELRRNPKE
jgi:predicted phosphodiesterase